MAKIEVVGAVFHRDNEILAFERDRGPLAGYWEFPGGKIEPGEDHRSALVRELAEELLISATVGDYIASNEHVYPFATVVLHAYFCQSADTISLTEHRQARWLSRANLDAVAWAPADLPIIAALRG